MKQTIIGSIKKAAGSEPSDSGSIRRVFHIGGPIAVINLLLVLLVFGLAVFDSRGISHGRHGIPASAFGAVLVVRYINGAL